VFINKKRQVHVSSTSVVAMWNLHPFLHCYCSCHFSTASSTTVSLSAELLSSDDTWYGWCLVDQELHWCRRVQ